MKMKKIALSTLFLFFIAQVFGWGQKGHDVTAYVAECHLTPKAAKQIDRILDGHSLVYYANWLDNASHTPEYAYTKTWHYLNIDEGKTLETMPRNEQGDVLTAVTAIYEKLKNGELSHEEEQFNLKMLIHLVGDMHCPMHTGHLSDRGGNDRPVVLFGRPSNLHSIWDSGIVEAAHKWGYTEWQQQIDRASNQEIRTIQAGTLTDWLNETQQICNEVYAKTPEGSKVSYDYVNEYAPVVEQQFLRGGLRLARLLNEIYR